MDTKRIQENKRNEPKKKKKKKRKRGLKEGNEKSYFQNPEGTVLRRGRVFYDMEVTLDDLGKH
jgi:hypothetical protein